MSGVILMLAAAIAAADVVPRAGLVAGAILRDEETLRAIEATAAAKLPKGAGLDLVVTKSRYRLDVKRGASLLKAFPVAFGGKPIGPKTTAGDGRTPEGSYRLVPHHPSPGFGRCFYICYPNEDDARGGVAEDRIEGSTLRRISAALRRGDRPPHDTPLGGLILLHGTKQRFIPALTETNWTTGCIAMENTDVEELLAVFSSTDRPLLTIRP